MDRVVTSGSSEGATVRSLERMSSSGCTSAWLAVSSSGVSAVGECSVSGTEVGVGWLKSAAVV